MSLPAETRTAVGGHIAAHWTERDGGCPMCGGSQWDAHGYVNVLMSNSPVVDDAGPVPQGFPAAALTCKGCGYVALLNLVAAGVPVAPKLP